MGVTSSARRSWFIVVAASHWLLLVFTLLSLFLCLSQDKMHGVVKFDPRTGVQQKGKVKTGSYTNYFADALIAEAERDNRIVAIHAAMAGGTGVWAGLQQQHALCNTRTCLVSCYCRKSW